MNTEDKAFIKKYDGDCVDCGHSVLLHNYHCCEYCKVCESLWNDPELDRDRFLCARDPMERV